MVELQTGPKAVVQAEVARQAQPRVHRDGTLARDDLADAHLWHAYVLGQSIGRYAHGQQELLRQDFAGMGVRYFPHEIEPQPTRSTRGQ